MSSSHIVRCNKILCLNDMNVLRQQVEFGIVSADTDAYLICAAAVHGNLAFVKYLLPLYPYDVRNTVMTYAVQRDRLDIALYICSLDNVGKFFMYTKAYVFAAVNSNLVLMDMILKEVMLFDPACVTQMLWNAIGNIAHCCGPVVIEHIRKHAGNKWNEVINNALMQNRLRVNEFEGLLAIGACVDFDNYLFSKDQYIFDRNKDIKSRINVVSRCD